MFQNINFLVQSGTVKSSKSHFGFEIGTITSKIYNKTNNQKKKNMFHMAPWKMTTSSIQHPTERDLTPGFTSCIPKCGSCHSCMCNKRNLDKVKINYFFWDTADKWGSKANRHPEFRRDWHMESHSQDMFTWNRCQWDHTLLRIL